MERNLWDCLAVSGMFLLFCIRDLISFLFRIACQVKVFKKIKLNYKNYDKVMSIYIQKNFILQNNNKYAFLSLKIINI